MTVLPALTTTDQGGPMAATDNGTTNGNRAPAWELEPKVGI